MQNKTPGSQGTGLPLLIACTVLCYFCLYGPQPLLPVFEQEFGIGVQAAAALITISFAFLASAPLLYGVLLEAWPARRVLQVALLVLSLSTVGFACAQSYGWLLTARALQSAALPAAITSIMALVAATHRQAQMQTAMAIYVATTIAGGYLGRLGAGAVAQFLDWRLFFFVVGGGLLALAVAAGTLPSGEGTKRGEKPTPRLIGVVLADPQNRTIYATIFCVFFTFATILSFIPFRLADLSGQSSPLEAGYIYSGYIIGIGIALASQRIADIMGGPRRAVLIACSIYVCATLSLIVPNTPLLFVTMFVFSGAMFLFHSLAIGHLNARTTRLHGLTNGLYVASYYAGGILGSYLPGLLYQSTGWAALCGLAALSAVASAVLARRIDWQH